MATLPEIKNVTRPINPKRVDQFYVEYLGLPENYGNILGRQTLSIERPTITFAVFDVMYKGNPNHQTANAGFESIQVIFEDDDQSLVTYALYRQLYRQNHNNPPIGEDSKFRIHVQAYDAQQSVVEDYTMLGCIITGLTHSEQVYSSSERNQITVTLNIDDCDYKQIASQILIKQLSTVD